MDKWVVAGALLIATGVEQGVGISCWICNSEYDTKCSDPFDNRTSALVDCARKDSQRIQNMGFPTEGQVCRKIIQKVEGKIRIIRDCGYIIDRSVHATAVNPNGTHTQIGDSACIKRAGTFSVLMQYCSCTSDGCNAGATLRPAAAINVGLLLVSFRLISESASYLKDGL